MGEHEPNLEDGLDHFKRCGHLAFWLRRMGPISEAIDTTQNLADSTGYDLSQDEIEFRELLLGYCNEYIAFDYAFQICKYYEIGKTPPSERAAAFSLSREYYQTICHFLCRMTTGSALSRATRANVRISAKAFAGSRVGLSSLIKPSFCRGDVGGEGLGQRRLKRQWLRQSPKTQTIKWPQGFASVLSIA